MDAAGARAALPACWSSCESPASTGASHSSSSSSPSPPSPSSASSPSSSAAAAAAAVDPFVPPAASPAPRSGCVATWAKGGLCDSGSSGAARSSASRSCARSEVVRPSSRVCARRSASRGSTRESTSSQRRSSSLARVTSLTASRSACISTCCTSGRPSASPRSMSTDDAWFCIAAATLPARAPPARSCTFSTSPSAPSSSSSSSSPSPSSPPPSASPSPSPSSSSSPAASSLLAPREFCRRGPPGLIDECTASSSEGARMRRHSLSCARPRSISFSRAGACGASSSYLSRHDRAVAAASERGAGPCSAAVLAAVTPRCFRYRSARLSGR